MRRFSAARGHSSPIGPIGRVKSLGRFALPPFREAPDHPSRLNKCRRLQENEAPTRYRRGQRPRAVNANLPNFTTPGIAEALAIHRKPRSSATSTLNIHSRAAKKPGLDFPASRPVRGNFVQDGAASPPSPGLLLSLCNRETPLFRSVAQCRCINLCCPTRFESEHRFNCHPKIARGCSLSPGREKEASWLVGQVNCDPTTNSGRVKQRSRPKEITS